MKIRKRIETQIVVKPFLVVSVTSLDLSVMPRGSRTDQFVLDLVVITEHVKRMDTIGFLEMGELHAIVGLDRFGSISEKENGTLYKIYG